MRLAAGVNCQLASSHVEQPTETGFKKHTKNVPLPRSKNQRSKIRPNNKCIISNSIKFSTAVTYLNSIFNKSFEQLDQKSKHCSFETVINFYH
ncbi:hypothetical protein T10_3547 [Trichinella papuae]|uniref:Uncharacterized protein n=1 Tax=Trichinella papuae TaxID=268474 RepID=A0A0V1N902_9BILA|nr:hypothetical protein T10_3547 [Trichinella papuae]